MTGGDVSLAFDIYNRFIERVGDAVIIATDMLDNPIDFTVDEEYVLDQDKRNFAKNADEQAAQWRKKIKYDMLQLKSGVDKADPVETIETPHPCPTASVPQ